MTDVVVLDLQNNKDLTIKCKDLVKKIALYKDRLAVRTRICSVEPATC